jgi:hypothetical protein
MNESTTGLSVSGPSNWAICFRVELSGNLVGGCVEGVGQLPPVILVAYSAKSTE